MNVTVTSRDIREGQRRGWESCPLALAVNRELGIPHTRVWVDYEEIVVTSRDGVRIMSADLPRDAVDFTSDFDSGRKVEPTTFEIHFRKGSGKRRGDWI